MQCKRVFISEHASISVYLKERGSPYPFILGGVVRGAVCGLDFGVSIHILDMIGGDEDHSLLSPRLQSVKEREGAHARKGDEAKRRSTHSLPGNPVAHLRRRNANLLDGMT